jgi:hypothetical protein
VVSSWSPRDGTARSSIVLPRWKCSVDGAFFLSCLVDGLLFHFPLSFVLVMLFPVVTSIHVSLSCSSFSIRVSYQCAIDPFPTVIRSPHHRKYPSASSTNRSPFDTQSIANYNIPRPPYLSYLLTLFCLISRQSQSCTYIPSSIPSHLPTVQSL